MNEDPCSKYPLQKKTVGSYLKSISEKFPERPAIEQGGTVWLYRDVDLLSDRIAVNLLRIGVSKGDRVALWSDNSPLTVIFFYALQKIGAIPVLIGHCVVESELEERIDEIEVEFFAVGEGRFIIEPSQFISKLRSRRKLKAIFSIGADRYRDIINYCELICEPKESYKEVLQKLAKEIKPEDSSVILFTSGTTGISKAVMTSHFSRINSGFFQAKDLNATEEDIFCVVLPMFHCFCLSSNIIAAMSIGACIHFPENRRTISVLRSIHYNRCSILNGVPTIFHSLIHNEDFGKFDLSSLRVGLIGGAGCKPGLFREIEKTLGCTLLSSLGMTESTAGITVSSFKDSIEIRSETVGHFMDWVEGKIVDISSGVKLPMGDAGEICVRGYVNMQGYYGNPELTALVLESDGWLHTGDIGYIDASGNLHVTGRLKELIIKGGENICPLEIERVLFDYKNVSEAKVLSVPDPPYGEEIFAFVVPRKGMMIDPDKLQAYLKIHICPFNVPKYFAVTDGLPTNGNGKIILEDLRAKANEAVEAGYRGIA